LALAPGSHLGPYEILVAIGAGGMGEVYRARDAKLNRDVAIKVLPEGVADDPERLARFHREAQVLAALNHPNIAHIHGYEQSNGVHALVMELVEGPTLADRIARGPIPLDEALPIARQIAGALEAAHEQGIVHRDLKPANVKVRDDGTVKVLDFGLAKAMESAAALSPEVSHSPTLTTPAVTRAGVILGTAAYMSPEQARGQRVDKRTDVWSFGCVVYEMLTGRPTFSGETVPDLIAMVLAREPDLTALPPATPVSVRRLLRRCVEKDVRRRLRDIGDARLELDEPPDEPTLARDLGRHLPDRDVAFKRLTDLMGLKESPAISPDGKMVAFVAFVAGKRQLWIRMLAGGAPIQLTCDPIDHEQPRWAPDSSTLIYYTPPTTHGGDGAVWEISALGGWPRRIVSAVSGADISRDGRRITLFQPSEDHLALVTVARDGSHRTLIATLPAGQGHALPRWSPDGRFIAFQRSSAAGAHMTLEIVSVADGTRRPVSHSHWLSGLCWHSDGSSLIYSSSRGSTVSYPPLFNLRTVTLDGSADRQLTFGDQSYVEPDTDAAGRLIARRIRSTSDIWKIPVKGSPSENIRSAVRITAQTGQVRTPSPSPDDAEVVYLSDNGGHGNLWIARTDGSAVRQVTFEDDPGVSVGVPKWSPTSDVIAFVMTRGEEVGLWTVHSDGSGLRQVVPSGRGPCWSADGNWLYYELGRIGTVRLEKVPTEGGESVVVRTEPGATIPAISPDGAELFYSVYLRSNLLGYVRSDREIRRARPEDGESETLARISNERISGLPPALYLTVSPDGAWLAMPLVDGSTTNLWLLPAAGGAMKRLTDFGDRSVEITRSISWSADGQHLYAAIADIETDIVLIDGLIQ
jgi:serine/threonine protein kinase/WD40 repeat protein